LANLQPEARNENLAPDRTMTNPTTGLFFIDRVYPVMLLMTIIV
jgi:hypothetical protein